MMIWSHNSEVGIISRDGMVGGLRSRFDSSRIARGQAACLLIRQFVSRFVPFRSKEIRGEYSFRETLKREYLLYSCFITMRESAGWCSVFHV